MTAAVWAGVLVIGGFGAVLRFLVDRAVSARSANPAIFSAASTAAMATGRSSDMLSDWSLRSSCRGPNPVMPRRTTLVATEFSA
ncbi:MAG: hypothetical protein QOF88_1916 [Mycobacterium sp.]|nr:hypothetical protein [Mycobacterium sp.]